MKTKSVLFLLTALLLVWAGAPVWASAETAEAPGPEAFEDGRSVYVGDIIALEIAAQGYSGEALREKFSDFDVVEIKNKPGGYSISLRSFETGEHTVLLGDKEIVIDVRSTIDDMEREDIFEGDARVIEPRFSFPWRVLAYVAAGIFILSGGFVLLQTALGKRIKTLSPHQRFLRRSASLSALDGNYLVDLTLCFKEYIENLYQCRIIGKTSAEIIAELKGIRALDAMLPETRAWLRECDRLKFTGVSVSGEEKQGQYENLLALVNKIDTQKEGAT